MMEEKIKQLMSETGADRHTVEMILDFTGGDIDGARKIFQAMPKDYLALKIRYMGHRTHNYGVILIVINIKTREIEEVELIVSKEIKASEVDTNLKFEKFRDAIREYIKMGSVNLIMIDRLKEGIKSVEFKEAIFRNLTPDGVININDLKIILSELMFKVLTDSNVAIKIDQEKIDIFRYTRKLKKDVSQQEEKSGEIIEGEKEEEKEKVERKQEVEIRSISLIILKIEPVLSPVKGVSITELHPGDEIMVRIIDERDVGDYLATLLGGKVGGDRVPIPATVKEMEKSAETENVMLLVEFGPGIAGRCFVPPEIKVQTPISDELADLKKLTAFSISPIWIIVLLIILFVIFVIITIFTTGE